MSKEGWLEREVSWSVFRPWQPRYFVLRNNELSWHSGPDTVSERGTGKTIPWDIGKCVLTNRPDVENCFMVHRTTDGRTLLVKAATPEEKHRCQADPRPELRLHGQPSPTPQLPEGRWQVPALKTGLTDKG